MIVIQCLSPDYFLQCHGMNELVKLFSSETAKMFETIKIVFDSNRGSIQPTMHSTGQFVRTIREGKILNL